MQYTITHTCGHREVVQIYGTNSHGERERKADWMASKPCRECERAAETASAKTQTEAAGLPALTGSPKQVAWAESIRAKAMMRLSDGLSHASGTEQERQAAYAALHTAVAKHTDARWWIDHQGGERTALREEYEAAYAAAMTAVQA